MSKTSQPVRLQKVLARAGIASRRAAEAMIAAGRVRVDGRVVTELGTKVFARSSRVEVDGQRIARESAVYILLHKPRGAVSTMQDPEGRPTVRDLLVGVPARVFPIGRLDFNTSGVLFATNDGDFAEGLMHPRRAVPKTYVIKVQGAMKPTDLDVWRSGVSLEDGKTLPAKAKLLRNEGDKTWIELTITEGRNQQVRRMGDATGFRVMRLARTVYAGVDCEGLRPGKWRYLTADELTSLKKEYGVPKRIVSPPEEDAHSHVRSAPRKPSAHDGTRERPRRPSGPGGAAAARRDPRAGGAGEDRGATVRRGPGGGSDAGRGSPETERAVRQGSTTRQGPTRHAPTRQGPTRQGPTRSTGASRGRSRPGDAMASRTDAKNGAAHRGSDGAAPRGPRRYPMGRA